VRLCCLHVFHQRLGPDGYELFGGLVQVKMDDASAHDDGDVLIGSLDESEIAAALFPSALTPTGDGGDDFPAGEDADDADVVQADAHEADLSKGGLSLAFLMVLLATALMVSNRTTPTPHLHVCAPPCPALCSVFHSDDGQCSSSCSHTKCSRDSRKARSCGDTENGGPHRTKSCVGCRIGRWSWCWCGRWWQHSRGSTLGGDDVLVVVCFSLPLC